MMRLSESKAASTQMTINQSPRILYCTRHYLNPADCGVGQYVVLSPVLIITKIKCIVNNLKFKAGKLNQSAHCNNQKLNCGWKDLTCMSQDCRKRKEIPHNSTGNQATRVFGKHHVQALAISRIVLTRCLTITDPRQFAYSVA